MSCMHDKDSSNQIISKSNIGQSLIGPTHAGEYCIHCSNLPKEAVKVPIVSKREEYDQHSLLREAAEITAEEGC